MRVAVQSGEKLNSMALPAVVGGAHWIVDANGRNKAFAEASGGKWAIKPADSSHVLSDSDESCIVVDPDVMSVVNIECDGRWSCALVFSPEDRGSLESQTFAFEGDRDITVGRAEGNSITYRNEFVSGRHLSASYHEGEWSIIDLGSTNGTFLNGVRITAGEPRVAHSGDVLTILDMHVVLGRGLFSINNPGGMVSVSDGALRLFDADGPDGSPQLPESRRRDFFYPALRFMRSIGPKQYRIDPPPAKEREDKTPLLTVSALRR